MTSQAQQLVVFAVSQVDGTIAQHLADRGEKQNLLRNGSKGDDLVIPQTAARWRDDNVLKTIMNDMKSQYQVLSHCCVKFTLLLSNTLSGKSNVSSAAVDSMVDEMAKTLQTLLNIYFRSLECSIADSLFDYISQGIRSVLVHLGELLVAYNNKNKDSMTYATGAVTRVADEMQKLPLGNKAAYRRFVMEKCMAIKETLQEFENYIISAKEHHSLTPEERLAKEINTLTVDDVEDNEDDDFDDENEGDNSEYTLDELAVVEISVEAIRLSLDLSKTVLNIMTSVGDRIAEKQSDDTDVVKNCQSVIAIMVDSVAVLESQVTDLGAELYPPVESTNSELVAHYNVLVANMQHTFSLLKVETIVTNLLESEVKALAIIGQRLNSCNGW